MNVIQTIRCHNKITNQMHKSQERGRVDDFFHSRSFEVDGGRHDVVRYLVEKKAETNWIVPNSVLWMCCRGLTDQVKAVFFV